MIPYFYGVIYHAHGLDISWICGRLFPHKNHISAVSSMVEWCGQPCHIRPLEEPPPPPPPCSLPRKILLGDQTKMFVWHRRGRPWRWTAWQQEDPVVWSVSAGDVTLYRCHACWILTFTQKANSTRHQFFERMETWSIRSTPPIVWL